MKTQNNSIDNLEQNQINTSILSNAEIELELELELGLGLEQKPLLGLVENAQGILAYARVAAVDGDTPMAVGLIDKVDERLSDIQARLDFVAGFFVRGQS